MPLLPGPNSFEERRSLDDSVTVDAGEDGSADLGWRTNVVVCCTGAVLTEDAAAERAAVEVKATDVVDEDSATEDSGTLDEDATGTSTEMEDAAGTPSGAGSAAELLFSWYTRRELTVQYACWKAEGLFCTKAWQEDACEAHDEDPHTAPAQAPQKVLSNTILLF